MKAILQAEIMKDFKTASENLYEIIKIERKILDPHSILS